MDAHEKGTFSQNQGTFLLFTKKGSGELHSHASCAPVKIYELSYLVLYFHLFYKWEYSTLQTLVILSLFGKIHADRDKVKICFKGIISSQKPFLSKLTLIPDKVDIL